MKTIRGFGLSAATVTAGAADSRPVSSSIQTRITALGAQRSLMVITVPVCCCIRPLSRLVLNGFRSLPFRRAIGPKTIRPKGTGQGLALFLNILAVLLLFVALIHLLESLLSLLPNLGDRPLTSAWDSRRSPG